MQKPVVLLAKEDVWAKLATWHTEDRRSTIKRTFELGDLIIMAVINAKMTEYEVIRRIRKNQGELALGLTTYNRAARIARVFTKEQRKILIDNAVSVEKCETLAGAKYDGKKRGRLAYDIKSGRMKAPWAKIEPDATKQNTNSKGREGTTDDDHGIDRNNPDFFDLNTVYDRHGRIVGEKLDIWLGSIIHRVVSKGISPGFVEKSVKTAIAKTKKLAG